MKMKTIKTMQSEANPLNERVVVTAKIAVMGRITMLLLCVLAARPVHSQELSHSAVWLADQGNGTYQNPILHADYADPDAIRIGDDYYMTSSSFNCMPGLPILHSKDLVNWKLVNHALKKLKPVEVYDVPQHGKGVWAPSMTYHKGEFYIYYPDPDYGIFMVKTKDPLGEWEEPICVLEGKGMIDPSVFRDDDGKVYLAVAWAGSRANVNSLLTLYRLDSMGTKVMDEGKHIFDGHGAHHTVEGPKIYKRNGFYYVFAPAGGVSTGWQLVLRSTDIYGPYEEKVVMDQGNSPINGPHQGAYVETPAGEAWFLHFQDKGAYGRLVHLQPVAWKDNWPVIGEDKDGDGKGEPMLAYRKPKAGPVQVAQAPPESDEFDTDTLGLQWQWHANPKLQWSALLRGKEYLRLFAYPLPKNAVNLWSVPNLLLQKFPAPTFRATTKVKYTVEWDVWQGKKAGLLIMGNDYSYLAIAKDDKGFKLQQIFCKNALADTPEKVMAEQYISSNEAYLGVEVNGPDATCQFYYSEDGNSFRKIGEPFKAQPDKWIGAKVGLFSVATPSERLGAYADFDWFRVEQP
jgi:beta-xylosidase